MTLMLGEVFIKALLLCGLLYLFARYEADYSFTKVAMVTGGLMLGSVIIEATVAPQLGVWTALVHVAFITFMIMTFCWTTLPKTLAIVAIYTLIHFALAFIGSRAMAYLARESGKSGMVIMGANEDEFRELQKEILNQTGAAANQLAASAGELSDTPPPEEVVEPARDEQPPPAPEPTPPPAESPPPSTTTLPAPPDAITGESTWETARRALNIGGTARGGGNHMVYINGQLREAGDFVSITQGGWHYRWRIKAIDENGLHLVGVDRRKTE